MFGDYEVDPNTELALDNRGLTAHKKLPWLLGSGLTNLDLLTHEPGIAGQLIFYWSVLQGRRRLDYLEPPNRWIISTGIGAIGNRG